jgi:hypothetical protein
VDASVAESSHGVSDCSESTKISNSLDASKSHSSEVPNALKPLDSSKISDVLNASNFRETESSEISDASKSLDSTKSS